MDLKKTVSLLLAGLMVLAVLGGCSGTDKRLYGYWADEYQETLYGFGTDGVGYTQMMGFTLPILFAMKGEKLYMLFGEEGEGDPLTDEDTLIYGVTFFGDDEMHLEYPIDSGSVTKLKRQSSSGS